MINTAWVRARLCKLLKGCTRLAAASDKVYQLLAHVRWFSPGTPASSTTKNWSPWYSWNIAESDVKTPQKTKTKINLWIYIRLGICSINLFPFVYLLLYLIATNCFYRSLFKFIFFLYKTTHWTVWLNRQYIDYRRLKHSKTNYAQTNVISVKKQLYELKSTY